MKKNVLFVLFLLMGIILHAQQIQPGLYVGDSFQAKMDFYDALDWITLNAQDGGEYSIVLCENLAVSSSVLDYNGKAVTISIKSSGSDIQLSYATRSPSSSLFTVKKGVTFILENGVELIGRPSASRPPVTVDGGTFIMNGGAIKDSKVDHSNSWYGGGVDILSGGCFIMNGGVISGNSCFAGAGVNVSKKAVFTMNGGEISNNNAYYDNSGFGGGVCVSGTFTLVDGIIKNNTSHRKAGWFGRGGGIFVDKNGKLIMQGGTISYNSDGGIFIEGEAIMNGGIIASNTSDVVYGGGGVHIEGTFTMNNGTIVGNDGVSGGGVYGRQHSSFIMNNGEIIGNLAEGNRDSMSGSFGGGGVCVEGSFTMNGGVISNNDAKGYKIIGGGGVLVQFYATFIMNDGIISKNKTTKSGGGVFVKGTFTKSNTAGIIYGSDASEDKANIADNYGHAVYTEKGSRDTTARATMALHSRKKGSEGGWE